MPQHVSIRRDNRKIRYRRKFCSVYVLASTLSCSPSTAFQNLQRFNHDFKQAWALNAQTKSTSFDPASRFHSDMLRILESRRNLASNASLELSPLERRKRPEVLSTDVDGAERVMGMLHHMESIGVTTEESYKIALRALVKRGRLRWRREDSLIVCAADEVTGIVHNMWGLYPEQPISVDTCNLALQAYAVCATPRGNRQYAQHAESLLRKMEEQGIECTAETFSHVVHAWAWQQGNMQPGECARMAQKNLNRLLERSPDSTTLLRSYHWLLEAFSKSSDEESKDRADEILDKMIELRKEDPSSIYPNENSFSNAILSWSKSPGEDPARRAQALLDMTVDFFENNDLPQESEPEIIAFNAVLGAWGRIGRVQEALTVFAEMKRLSSKWPGLRPDIVSYNNLLNAYLRLKDKAAALEGILKLVGEMEDCDKHELHVKPDSFTYSLVLKAWAQSKHPDAALRAVETLGKMRELWILGDKSAKPSNRHYNIAINALAKSREHLDARKAHELLLQMQASSNFQPDIISFTSVIECFSKSNDPEAAEISIELLEQAMAMYEEQGNENLKPNLRTYSMVISAMATNPTIENVSKARQLLVELLESHKDTKDPDLRPNAFPFNYALNCAANCVGTNQQKGKAFQLAAQTYNDIRKSDETKPDSFTYAFWFKCCNNLLPPGEIRAKGVSLAFQQCREDGLLGRETLHRLLAGTPPEVIVQLLNLEPKTSPAIYRSLTVDDLPPAWSRNVN